MILDGVCYPVILFGRAILYVGFSPPVFSLSLGEYLVPCYIYEYFRLRTSIDVLYVFP